MSDKVSIIIPVYNKESTIYRCLKSVKMQSYSEFEVFVIDDGSIDASALLCDNFAVDDQRFNILHIENGGVSNARNVGLDMSTGEYICFLDADDYLHPDFLIDLITALENHPTSEIAIASFFRVCQGEYKEERLISKLFEKDSINVFYEYEYGKDNVLRHVWGAVFRKSIIERQHIRFNMEIYVGEDSLFMAEMIVQNPKIVIVNRSLYYYVIEGESASHGCIDEKKATAIDAWDRIIELYSQQSLSSKKIIYGCYLSQYLECVQALKQICTDSRHSVNREIYLKYKNTINKLYWHLRKNKMGMKDKIELWSVRIIPKLYFRLLKRFRGN